MLRVFGDARAAVTRGLIACAAASVPACLLDGSPLGSGPAETVSGGDGGAGAAGAGSAGDAAGGGVPAGCGDGVIDGAEECEPGAPLGEDCEDRGHPPGELTCSPSCKVDTSGCTGGEPWWDPAWGYRMSVTIDGTMSPQDWPSFVTLVVVEDIALADAQPDGDDLVFVREGSDMALAHEIERFEPDVGRLVAWVRVPALKAGEPNELFLYFGNPGVGSQAAANVVWGGDDVAVWHLGEEASDEQTSAQHPASGITSFAGAQLGNKSVAGKIGLAQAFDGDNDHIEIKGGGAIVLSDTNCTVSAWVRTNDQNPRAILTKSESGTHTFSDIVLGAGKFGPHLGVDSHSVGFLDGDIDITDGAWHHVVWTQSKNSGGGGGTDVWRLYVDGKPDGGPTQIQTKVDEDTFVVRIGGGVSGSYFAGSWRGEIDEVRIASVARDEPWVTTTYNNQSDPGKYVKKGPVQKSPLPAP